MAVCAACRAGRPPQPAADEAEAVLVVRVWTEEEGLRARLLSGERAVVAQGVDAICDEVRRWLTDR